MKPRDTLKGLSHFIQSVHSPQNTFVGPHSEPMYQSIFSRKIESSPYKHAIPLQTYSTEHKVPSHNKIDTYCEARVFPPRIFFYVQESDANRVGVVHAIEKGPSEQQEKE